MESKVNYTVVGAFVIILMAAITVGIIWLSAGISTVHYNPYVVYMNEAVTGLSLDSPVKYNGVDVGYVKDIQLSPTDPQRVKLLLDVKVGTPVTTGTTATLNVQGLTGIAYISLQGTAAGNQPLKAHPGEKYPVIKTAPSLLLRLDTAVRDLTQNLGAISARTQLLLNDDNQRAVKQALININKMTDVFTNQTLPAANQALTNLNATSLNLLATVEEIKQNPAVLVRGRVPQLPGPGEK